jgi:hypothetical protein
MIIIFIILLVLVIFAMMYSVSNYSEDSRVIYFDPGIEGIADRLFGIVGAAVLCKYLNYKLVTRIDICGGRTDRCYDKSLINFRGIISIGESGEQKIATNGSPQNMAPYRLYLFLKERIPGITFEEICREYERIYREDIYAPEIITKNYPDGIEDAYGIHLRKGDKLRGESGKSFTSADDLEVIINNLINDVKDLNNPKIFIVSDTPEWRDEIIKRIGDCTILEPKGTEDIEGYSAVFDMFCLSKCKKIFAGSNYSGFFINAALLESKPLVDYSGVINNNHLTCTRLYDCVLNSRNYSLDFYKNAGCTHEKEDLPLFRD